MEDTRIAVLSIIVEDSESTAKLNEMIHDYAEYVVGRMGIPYREKNISIISLVIDGIMSEMNGGGGTFGLPELKPDEGVKATYYHAFTAQQLDEIVRGNGCTVAARAGAA